MQTFNEKLANAKNQWQIKKDYDKQALPEVLAYLKQKKAEVNGDTVFNAQLATYIAQKENVPNELLDYLNTEVYLAQHDLQKEKDNEYTAKMIQDGFTPLTSDTPYRGKIELIATKHNDWLTTNISQEATLKMLPDGHLFVIPKGNRTRGYFVRNLEQAFYKPLTK